MRTDEFNKDLIVRLNRLIGQVNGVKNMVEKDSSCEDILVQLLACKGVVTQIGKLLINNHLVSCLRTAIKEGADDHVEEFIEILDKFLK